MKTYRRHACKAKHRTYQRFARCTFPRAAWVAGEGPFACLSWCGALTVLLCGNEQAALDAQKLIDSDGCGHACYKEHEVVELVK